ncbi:MAG: hypothetical protein R3228_09470, partial [Halioglobus sp.]|nr:hypothetical protein [Halioglobus sp.]
ENFNLHSANTIRYFGDDDRQQLRQQLAQQLPGCADSLDFLLDRGQWPGQDTYGMSRTLCLLLSVGCRAIVMDDDVLCSAIDSPFAAAGVRFADSMNEVDFYPSTDGWRRRFGPRAENPLTSHLQCLGLGIGDALHALGIDADDDTYLADSEYRVMRRLGPDSRVLITQNGTFGDPGTQDTSWCFNLQGDSLQRLLDNPDSLQAKLATRQYWMGFSRATFSTQGALSQVTGLDNSVVLPPYFPAWRGEDQVFGAMVHFLYPGSLVLNYPWAVPHLPLEERTGRIDDSAGRADMGLVESWLNERARDVPNPDFTARLAALAQVLRDVRDKPDEDLSRDYRLALGAAHAAAVSSLTAQMRDAPEAHKPWRALLTQRRQGYLAALGRPDVPVRVDGVADDTPEAVVWDHLRRYCGSFAKCLEDWPAIRDAAAAIAASGD